MHYIDFLGPYIKIVPGGNTSKIFFQKKEQYLGYKLRKFKLLFKRTFLLIITRPGFTKES
ncbi:MAG: hypothetical protein COB46_05865 [Rhodospirillaceae bacterium]|nr:MAG: hypothetical protein COB46_05865 [Rhodospirillaceae bacterium]